MYNLYLISGIPIIDVELIARLCLPYFLSLPGRCKKANPQIIYDEFKNIPDILVLDHDSKLSQEDLISLITSKIKVKDVLIVGHIIPNCILPIIPKYHIHLAGPNNARDFEISQVLYKWTYQKFTEYYDKVGESNYTNILHVYNVGKLKNINDIVNTIIRILIKCPKKYTYLMNLYNSNNTYKINNNTCYSYYILASPNDFYPTGSELYISVDDQVKKYVITAVTHRPSCIETSKTIYHIKYIETLDKVILDSGYILCLDDYLIILNKSVVQPINTHLVNLLIDK
jgi:hypothetical protein